MAVGFHVMVLASVAPNVYSRVGNCLARLSVGYDEFYTQVSSPEPVHNQDAIDDPSCTTASSEANNAHEHR